MLAPLGTQPATLYLDDFDFHIAALPASASTAPSFKPPDALDFETPKFSSGSSEAAAPNRNITTSI